MRLLMVCFLITFFSANCHAEEHKLHSDIHIFQGEKFEIELKVNCPKSELTCNDVGYNAINKKQVKKFSSKVNSCPTRRVIASGMSSKMGSTYTN